MILVDTRQDAEPFQMGSHLSEPGASWDERRHLKRIGRRFAVSAYETTVEQFRRFVSDRPQTSFSFRGDERDEEPVVRVSWLLAAEYCNWLSEKAELPKSEWCYEIVDDRSDGPRYQLAENYLSRSGFRLPSEAEWEYCCRASSRTARPFGDSDDRLKQYGWFEANADNRTHAVGKLKPNAFGFFDMLGNAREWCQELWKGKLTRIDTIVNNDHEDRLDVEMSRTRITKGGAFDELAVKLRSSNRIGFHPHLRLDSIGFRVARTVENAN